MVTVEQRQRLFKARIALALYAKYGRVPRMAEINRNFYERVRLAHTHAAMRTVSHQAEAPQQPTLFSLSPATKYLAEFQKTRSFISLS